MQNNDAEIGKCKYLYKLQKGTYCTKNRTSYLVTISKSKFHRKDLYETDVKLGDVIKHIYKIRNVHIKITFLVSI